MSLSIAKFVKQKRLKITQSELAERAGIELRFIRNLERGKPSLRLLLYIFYIRCVISLIF